jgi:hypothetical protein
MANRVLGNNTSFTFSDYSGSPKITTNDWNLLVHQNLTNMQSVAERVPITYRASVSGTIQSSATATPYGSSISSRHFSVLANWFQMPDNGSGKPQPYDIVPKSVVTGVSSMNTASSNYWVFQTPGIYHINIEIKYNVTTIPAMIRIAAVPYINDGVNYHLSAPFDNTYTTLNNTMPLCFAAYTGKADYNITGSDYKASVSSFFVVTSQTSSNYPSIGNIVVNKTNPLTAGNGYHIEMQGFLANNDASPRFAVTGGVINITLLQEWWR